MPESGRGGVGGRGEVDTDTHMHTHSYTSTSHTFRGGRRRADMTSCHLEEKGEGRERRRGFKKKKKSCSILLSIMCILREKAGRMP